MYSTQNEKTKENDDDCLWKSSRQWMWSRAQGVPVFTETFSSCQTNLNNTARLQRHTLHPPCKKTAGCAPVNGPSSSRAEQAAKHESHSRLGSSTLSRNSISFLPHLAQKTVWREQLVMRWQQLSKLGIPSVFLIQPQKTSRPQPIDRFSSNQEIHKQRKKQKNLVTIDFRP